MTYSLLKEQNSFQMKKHVCQGSGRLASFIHMTTLLQS